MLAKDVPDSLIEQSCLEAMAWFYSVSKQEGDIERDYYERILDWFNFNVAFRTPFVNFYSGMIHKDLGLEDMIDGARLNACFKNACMSKLEELGQ